ncbi:MAG TPA: hypothetical protein VH183_08785 [Burkholderiaceae bacterium]|jgi:hypothetical protein|nr:hypothetical protein [Burkholderiaceae bacterium]
MGEVRMRIAGRLCMRFKHACDSINSFVAGPGKAQSGATGFNGGSMKSTPHFSFLDDIFFVIALFAPVSMLLSGSLALVAIG